jgi:hypothetical protein
VSYLRPKRRLALRSLSLEPSVEFIYRYCSLLSLSTPFYRIRLVPVLDVNESKNWHVRNVVGPAC